MGGYVLRVLQVEGQVAGLMQRGVEGTYISGYQPDAYSGRGSATYTRYAERALQFRSPSEAIAFWRQQSAVRPFREDGEPNRPLTAITVAVEVIR